MTSIPRRSLVLGAIFLFVMLPGVGVAMFSKVLCSQMDGVVLRGGQPVAGVQVEREYQWQLKDMRGHDVVTTDAEGRFHFDEATGSTIFGSILPHEPVILQKVTIQDGDDSVIAWAFQKHDYDRNGELDGRPIRLSCELEAEPSRKQGVFGVCELLD